MIIHPDLFSLLEPSIFALKYDDNGNILGFQQHEDGKQETGNENKTKKIEIKNNNNNNNNNSNDKMTTTEQKKMPHIVTKGPIQMVEHDDYATLHIDMPGYQHDNIKVVVRNGYIYVSGTRTNKFGYQTSTARQFQIDPMVSDIPNITASLMDDVLSIQVPKSRIPTTFDIPITTNGIDSTTIKKKDDNDYKSQMMGSGVLLESTKTHSYLSLDLPGFKASDMKIHMERGVISISGTRTNKFGATASISRSFAVDMSNTDVLNIVADLCEDDGVLTIVIPKKKEVVDADYYQVAVLATPLVPPKSLSNKVEDEKSSKTESLSKNTTVDEHVTEVSTTAPPKADTNNSKNDNMKKDHNDHVVVVETANNDDD